MQKAVQELREGDVVGYVNTFVENNKMTKEESRKLQSDIQAIIRGYGALPQKNDESKAE